MMTTTMRERLAAAGDPERADKGLARTARRAGRARAGASPADESLAREALALYERLVVEGAWWDLVDDVATHRISALLMEHPALVAAEMRAWARSDDVWKRRSAIICQVGAKAATDVALLSETIALAVGDERFWLRKAIGWALREYAKTAPDWVRAHVTALGDRLSGLSRREALKHL